MSYRKAQERAAMEPLTLLQAAEVAEWYEAFTPRLRQWLNMRGPVSARCAEDVIQDVFVAVMEQVAKIAAMDTLGRRRYVGRIAANMNLTAVRTFHIHQRIAGADYFSQFEDVHSLPLVAPERAAADWLAHAQPDGDPEQSTEARMTLHAAWEMLSERERAILSLTAQGYHPQEIAARLGLTPSSVRVFRWRLRGKLLEIGKRLAS